MTTWPGFGDGTFHDPDRYVREGREKDDPKKVRKVIAVGSFSFSADLYEKVRKQFENQEVSMPTPYQEFPFACTTCGQRYRLLVSANACPHIKPSVDSP